MIAAVVALGAGAWAANEFGYINFKEATGNLPLPVLVCHHAWAAGQRSLSTSISSWTGQMCRTEMQDKTAAAHISLSAFPPAPDLGMHRWLRSSADNSTAGTKAVSQINLVLLFCLLDQASAATQR